MLLVDREIGPGVEDVEENFSCDRLRNDPAASRLTEIDRVFVLRDALRLEVEILLQSIAVDRSELRIRQSCLIVGGQLFELAIRFQNEHRATELAERDVF